MPKVRQLIVLLQNKTFPEFTVISINKADVDKTIFALYSEKETFRFYQGRHNFV